VRLGLRLRKRNFDLVIDLRSTLYPLLVNALYRTTLFKKTKGKQAHKRYAHLTKLIPLGLSVQDASYNIFFSEDDKRTVKMIFKGLNILQSDKIVAIAPGAKSHIKRWTISGFARLCQRLSRELGAKILLVGDNNDKEIISRILSFGLNDAYDISSRTNIRELGYLLSQCKLLVTNDSAPLHIADIVNTPTVSIFGPTDEKKYGPILKNSAVIRKNLRCSPCEKAQCAFDLECIRQIGADEVFEAAKRILGHGL
jgi:ADP-heptose:LPS heptosyltransferase